MIMIGMKKVFFRLNHFLNIGKFISVFLIKLLCNISLNHITLANPIIFYSGSV